MLPRKIVPLLAIAAGSSLGIVHRLHAGMPSCKMPEGFPPESQEQHTHPAHFTDAEKNQRPITTWTVAREKDISTPSGLSMFKNSANAHSKVEAYTITMVKLKNGSEAPRAAVMFIMVMLEKLMKKDPIGFYNLVGKCRNPHIIFDKYESVPEISGLMTSGKVRDFARNIVLSAVEEDDTGTMHLTSPLAPEGKDEEMRLASSPATPGKRR